jgi:hypothetical protein
LFFVRKEKMVTREEEAVEVGDVLFEAASTTVQVQG